MTNRNMDPRRIKRTPTVAGGIICAALALAFAPVSGNGAKVKWTATVEEALATAGAETRIVVLALGEAGEGRTKRHLKELYPSKDADAHLDHALNVPAWSFSAEEEKELPRFSGVEPRNHRNNFAAITERWVAPNESGVIALPHHVWLSPAGEVLLSCPWEIDALEFAWCCDDAMRRAGIEDRPELPDGAHPPRRLLIGETYRVFEDDQLGRGLEPDELETSITELNKRFVTMGDQGAVIKIMFTDEDDAAEFLLKQIGLWDLGGGTRGIVDGTMGLIGLIAPAVFVDVLEEASRSGRQARRAQVAVAYEQIGSPEGLAVVKRAWKKEDDDVVRAEWIRALGACGRDDKAAVRTIVKTAERDKSSLVRRSSIIALGHVLPNESALEFLEETVAKGRPDERDAAILALALGRATGSRALVATVKEGDVEAATIEVVDAALGVLDGGNLYLLEDQIARVSESEIGRGRLFFRPAGEALRRIGR